MATPRQGFVPPPKAKLIRRRKLLYTILPLLIAVGTLPVLVLGWYLLGVYRETLAKYEQRLQIEKVENSARQIELYISKYRGQSAGLARALELNGGFAGMRDGGLVDERLKRFLEDDPNLIALELAPLNKDGFYVNKKNRITAAEVKALSQEVGDALNDNAYYVSRPRLSKAGEPIIVLGVPVMVGGRPESFVIAAVSMNPVFQVGDKSDDKQPKKTFNEMLVAGTSVVFIVDKDGRVLAHPDQQLVDSGTNLKSLKIVEDWTRSGGIVSITRPFTTTINGKQVNILGSYSAASIGPEDRIGVIIVVNESAAYASILQITLQALALMILVAAVAASIGIVLANRLAAPIHALAARARAIAGGDFGERMFVTSNNELGQLAEDFNTMADNVQQHIADLQIAVKKNRKLFIESVRSIVAALDEKDPYTSGHSERVTRFAVAIAEQMRMSPDEVEKIRIGSLLHDIGKIGIDERILRKPAKLTEEEFEIMKSHPQRGANILQPITELHEFLPGAAMHHERLDGLGYPLGLKGDQIPMMARIVSVADTFDAMTTARPYQRAIDIDYTFNYMLTQVDKRYDGRVVNALMSAYHSGKITVNQKPEPAMV